MSEHDYVFSSGPQSPARETQMLREEVIELRAELRTFCNAVLSILTKPVDPKPVEKLVKDAAKFTQSAEQILASATSSSKSLPKKATK
jgi:cell division septum initiation protein DivIVA